ncbi:hypothetical protein GS532_16790 [Rhodococcus hoagii]|nr:hypothetical protein [Prescottella equi]
MLVFATEDQLSSWMGTPGPLNAGVLLREASTLVRSACRADVFDPLPNGLPVDDDKREALQDATCAQASVWAATDVNPTAGAGGLAREVVSSSIDGASVVFNTATTDSAKAASIGTLCSAALPHPPQTGLGSSAVQS